MVEEEVVGEESEKGEGAEADVEVCEKEPHGDGSEGWMRQTDTECGRNLGTRMA